MHKPYSQACENNKYHILAKLADLLPETARVLEIGCGTGQHAVHFAAHLTKLTWLPTDREENLPGSRLWIDDAQLSNLQSPVALDVMQQPWPVQDIDAVYSANTAHIMPWAAVEAMFAGVGNLLLKGGLFLLYGPFRYTGEYTSASNQAFDRHLQQQDPAMGIRDLEALTALAEQHNLVLAKDYSLPANNQLLVWRKS